MTHISYTNQKNTVELTTDYVVVGSGAGGATAAVTLARGGQSVALIEAGAWREPHDYPSSMFGAMRDLYDNFATNTTIGRALWPVLQARTVGGGTVLNSAIVVRTPETVFDLWHQKHGIGGPQFAKQIWDIQDALERDLWVNELPPQARGLNNKLVHQSAMQLGMESHYIRRNVRECIGSAQCNVACRANRKQSTNINYVPELLNRGGWVFSCAPAQRIVFEKDRAIGVTGRFEHPNNKRRGSRFQCMARKAIIVAASATQSPLLLRRSGLKQKNIGRFFRAHPGTGILGMYAKPINIQTGATQGWASHHFLPTEGIKFESLSLPIEIIGSRLPGVGQAWVKNMLKYPYLGHWCATIQPEATGIIRQGFKQRPLIHYSLNQRDMHRLRRAVYLLATLHRQAGAQSILPGIHGIPSQISPDQIDTILEAPLHPRCWTSVLSHLFGGCVMGRDRETSVCDPTGQVHDIQGLYIADASAFPSTIGVNPQHSIMALARHQAEHLLNK